MEIGGIKYTADDYITLPSGHKVLKKEFERSHNPSRNMRNSEKVVIDKLPSMSGSIAGASSKFLLAVQKHKQKEEARVAELERDAAKEAEEKEFERQRLERKRQFDEEAAKKREKRQRRKAKHSNHGLELPVDVVQQIVEDERRNISNKISHPPEPTKSHPLSNSVPIPPIPTHFSPAKVKPMGPGSIRIVEEDN